MSDDADAVGLARRVAAAMWADDAASAALGMRITSVEPGRAVLEMPVRADMVNGHGIAHGGLVFALADSAFAFACNSRNRRTVAQACDIVFVAPARSGDVLVAEAVERTTFGRNGIYDVTVQAVRWDGTEDGGPRLIAEFRGRSRQIEGTIVGPEAEQTAEQAGFEEAGFEEACFEEAGFEQADLDEQGTDEQGTDEQGTDEQGSEEHGLDESGFERQGFEQQQSEERA